MTIQERTIYRCGFCRKYYLQKHSAERHEKYCSKNPANAHACFQCIHLSVERSDSEDGGYNEKTFTCTKLEKQMHSYKAERIDHSCLGYTERMPLTCPDLTTEIEEYFNNK